MNGPKKDGIDLAGAREKLAGTTARRLDGDWLAIDRGGRVAFFAGNERGVVPVSADRFQVGEVLDAIARVASAKRAAAVSPDDAGEAYRGLAIREQEPVFDAPCSQRGRPAHEAPIEGYPLLVVAANPAHVREVASEWTAREAVTREAYAAVFPVIGAASYEQLHESGACAGCRVLDDPADPRTRAPEALAAAGIYVYAHLDEDSGEPYRRVAGPTIAAALVDLEPVVQMVASLVKLPITFETEDAVFPKDYVPCTT